MNEYENSSQFPQEDAHYEVISNPEVPQQDDRYTYYAGNPSTPSEYRYVPAPKKKKKKQPWALILVLVLCCSLLSGVLGAGSVLLVQRLQAENAPETPEVSEENVSYLLQGVRENAVIEMVEVETQHQ